jgi:beta-hydroxyacyl-ACP dehydratase FabZ
MEGSDQVVIDIEGIKRLIPHRYPFLFVDRIVELVAGERIVGIKNVSAGEPFFVGHFPAYPVMPGVIILESLAQTGAIMMLAGDGAQGGNKIPFFAGVDKVKFRRQVVPGDQLRLELSVLRQRSGTCRLAGKASVNGEVAAEAEILAVIREVDGVEEAGG